MSEPVKVKFIENEPLQMTGIYPDPTFVTMELEEVVTRRFMAKYPRYEPKIKDSTAMQALKTCARKYFFQIVLGRVGNDEAIYFAWGSAYHTFRHILERDYGVGADAPNRYDENRGMEAFTNATNAGINYWKKHGKEQPAGSKWEFMTTERLMRSFMVAYKHWVREKQQGRIEVIAVEQAFNVQLRDGSSTSGRADQIIRWNGKLWGRDFKTSSKNSGFYQRQLEPNDQFTRYTLAEGKLCGEQVQGQFVELLYNAKPTKYNSNGPEIVELTTSRTAWQLAEFEEEQILNNRVLALYREEDRWPMHEPSCPFCPYHSVCTKPTEQSMMAQLELHFHVRPWDNTKVGIEP